MTLLNVLFFFFLVEVTTCFNLSIIECRYTFLKDLTLHEIIDLEKQLSNLTFKSPQHPTDTLFSHVWTAKFPWEFNGSSTQWDLISRRRSIGCYGKTKLIVLLVPHKYFHKNFTIHSDFIFFSHVQKTAPSSIKLIKEH